MHLPARIGRASTTSAGSARAASGWTPMVSGPLPGSRGYEQAPDTGDGDPLAVIGDDTFGQATPTSSREGGRCNSMRDKAQLPCAGEL